MTSDPVGFRPPGCIRNVRALFAVLACFSIGAIMLVAPDDLREEISDEHRRLIAAVSIGFGVLFGSTVLVMNLSSRGARAAAVRLRGLLTVAVFLAILWLCHFFFWPKLHAALRLAHEGKPTTVLVEGHETRRTAKETFTVTHVRYPDRQRATIDGKHGTRGGRLDVLYLDADRSTVLPGRLGDDTIALLGRDPGHPTTALFAGLALMAAIFIPFGLWRFLLGKRLD